ncbi:MAG: DUF3105 domain-containing protein [Chloroflexi bacterium]|nr:DUF3105 domain-containing protein [Chloroflexota bacterium]
MNTGNRRTGTSRRAARAVPRQSFVARNRRRLLWGLAAVALVGMAGLTFLNATSPAYACTTQWSPAPTSTPAPDATQRLGYVQNDAGRDHPALGSFVRYAVCPPASGNHYNAEGEGPVRAEVYGPNDPVIPQGWIHNLEHGGLVLLYRCKDSDTACTDGGQAALRQYYKAFPNSPLCNLPPGGSGPVIARFDQMNWPYAALLWGLVLPLDSLDTAQVNAFFAQQGDRTSPEQCPRPSPTPPPLDTPAPSASATVAPTDTVAPSAEPSASPTPGAS